MKKFMKGVRFTPKNYSDEVEAKIQHYKKEGYKLPMRSALRTEEQLAGIRASAKINTALLDYLSENIREGMSTAEIDHMVYCFTTDHDAIPAPFMYEGFPKSVCTSINDVVCHGIPSTREFLKSGDIVNVDVPTKCLKKQAFRLIFHFQNEKTTHGFCRFSASPRTAFFCCLLHAFQRFNHINFS